MKKKILAFVLAAIMILGFMPQNAKADGTNPPSVTVYLSISNDGEYVTGNTGQVMALVPIEVPYFDLANYGLADYYFNSDYMGVYGQDPSWPGPDPQHPLPPKSQLTPGTAQYAYGFVTMLHVLIYALEVYQEGNPGSVVFQSGRSLPTSDFNPSGTVGSMYLLNFWGMNYNFNYYKNYEYPLASSGWGATMDQILVTDGDIITVGHFTSYDFFSDPTSIFNYIKVNGSYNPASATRGDVITLSGYHAGIDYNTFTATAHTPLGSNITVYAKPVNSLTTNVAGWTAIGTTDANGQISFQTAKLPAGTYILAVAGQLGSTYTTSICSTPGGIRLNLADFKFGDVDRDGDVDADDYMLVWAYINNSISFTPDQFKAADVDGSAIIDSTDFSLIYQYVTGTISQFPIETP